MPGHVRACLPLLMLTSCHHGQLLVQMHVLLQPGPRSLPRLVGPYVYDRHPACAAMLVRVLGMAVSILQANAISLSLSQGTLLLRGRMWGPLRVGVGATAGERPELGLVRVSVYWGPERLAPPLPQTISCSAPAPASPSPPRGSCAAASPLLAPAACAG